MSDETDNSGNQTTQIPSESSLHASARENFSRKPTDSQEDSVLQPEKQHVFGAVEPESRNRGGAGLTPVHVNTAVRTSRLGAVELPEVPTHRSRVRPTARVFGREVRQRLRALGARLLPPEPTAELIPTVRVPAPALIPGEHCSDDDAVAMLARAYRGAVERSFRTASMFMLRGVAREHKDFARLELAARLMREAEIAPAAWVLFSFSVWREFSGRSGPPPVSFVFSQKRLAERLEWFEQERDRWSSGQMLVTREHRTLAEDHHAMWRELLAYTPDTREGVRVVVERWFPGDSWERRVADARAVASRLQREVEQQVALGCVLWDEQR